MIEDDTGLLELIRKLYEAQASASNPCSRSVLRDELFSAASYAINCTQVPPDARSEIKHIMYRDAGLGILWAVMSGADAYLSKKYTQDKISFNPPGVHTHQK